ncbi:hypothetical protein [Gorillibacterium timonense]|uniref:hypothetical protein n=1 Tax=Gorillibacterium timonense TaxID=1689269 RepID=UPI00071CAB35|nr:hypothetical protein [Gorillibacterium timonense]
MQSMVTKEEARKLVGQTVYALKKDGAVVSGKLLKVKGDQLYLSSTNGKKASTKAVIPLVLFDLLAIGTNPWGWGGGFGGWGPGWGGWGPGLGGWGGFW